MRWFRLNGCWRLAELTPLAGRPTTKLVCQEDVLAWLDANPLREGQAIVASIPDAAELPNSDRDPWKVWFQTVARRVIECAPEHSPVVFYQSDVRHAGGWIDKSYLVQQMAEQAGATLLLHRVVCRHPAGTITFGRSTYSHLLMFGKKLRNSQRFGYSDVIPDGGPAAWVRGIGLHSCEAIVRMIKQESVCDSIVHLFCGKGLLLEIARREGYDVVGVDLSKKQCRHAERFDLDKFKEAVLAPPSADAVTGKTRKPRRVLRDVLAGKV